MEVKIDAIIVPSGEAGDLEAIVANEDQVRLKIGFRGFLSSSIIDLTPQNRSIIKTIFRHLPIHPELYHQESKKAIERILVLKKVYSSTI